MFLPNLIGKAANLITKVTAAKNKAQANINKFKKPAPKPAPRPAPKPAPRPALRPAPPRPVVQVIPPAPKPAPAPIPADTVSVFGMKVPKPVAYIGGAALLTAVGIGISKAVRR